MKDNELITLAKRTLNSLDVIGRVEANPFLYGKIQSRLAAGELDKNENKWLSRLVFVLLLLFFVNIYSITSFTNSAVKTTSPGIDTFARDYSLDTGADNI